MNKLLSAGFARMKLSKAFWIGTAFMAALGVFMPVMRWFDMKRSGYTLSLDTCFFAYALFGVIVASVFCSLFIGTEYSDGTIRNKLVVGHSRDAVYLTNLILCFSAVLAMQAVYAVIALAIGIPLLGLEMGAAQLAFLIFCVAAAGLAFAALFNLAAMLCSSKAIVAIICILGAGLLLFFGLYISSALEEPEFYSAYSYIDSFGNTTEMLEEPNPSYVSGAKREVYEFLLNFLPGGQTVQLAGNAAEQPTLFPVYSALLIVLSSAAGVIFFRKKDIK